MNTTTYWKSSEDGNTLVKFIEIPNDQVYAVEETMRSTAVFHGARAEQIIVLEIDKEEYTRHEPPNGEAKPLEWNQTFPSGLLLSKHLGFATNSVALALGKERRKLEQEAEERRKEIGENYRPAIRPKATLRGVTFQYLKDLKD